MVTLQSKVEDYKSEQQQLKKTLKRSDDRIEQLNEEIEQLKNYSNRKSPTYAPPPLPAVVSSSGNRAFFPAAHPRKSETKPTNLLLQAYASNSSGFGKASSSASTVLKNFVRNNGGGTSLETRGETGFVVVDNNNKQLLTNGRAGSSSSNENSDSECTPEKIKEKPPTDETNTVVVDGERTDKALISDPSRFPACVKLLELSKAHQFPAPAADDFTSFSPPYPLYRSRRHNSQCSPTTQSPQSSPVMSYQSSARRSNSVSFSPNSSMEEQNTSSTYSRDVDNNDDITIVMPSSEGGSPWLHPPATSSIYTNPSSGFSRTSRQTSSEVSLISSPHSWTSSSTLAYSPLNFNGITKVSRTTPPLRTTSVDVITNSERGFMPPVKKIKAEVLYK